MSPVLGTADQPFEQTPMSSQRSSRGSRFQRSMLAWKQVKAFCQQSYASWFVPACRGVRTTNLSTVKASAASCSRISVQGRSTAVMPTDQRVIVDNRFSNSARSDSWSITILNKVVQKRFERCGLVSGEHTHASHRDRRSSQAVLRIDFMTSDHRVAGSSPAGCR
jgi:hypothetical protein